MQYLPQLIFILLTITAVYLFSKKAKQIKRNIFLGRDEEINDNKNLRWKNVLLLAFGQKKMFKNPLVAVMHFFVYAGFIIINIEVLEIVLDGILGTHRLFAKPLGSFYTLLINAFEILAVLVIIFCATFLIRRNIIKLKRFASNDLNGWPRSDANYILITEIILMFLFLKMNACDTLLQSRGYGHYGETLTGNFIISSNYHFILQNFSNQSLVWFERTCWWVHITGIFIFLNYLPYSKHLHILLAFPNAYYARLIPQGKMKNMPDIQNEVLYAMQPELAPTEPSTEHKKFGAKDVFDLSWKNLLDAYSCTECGRCTAACPANITGKLLSPRTIMMKTRDRLEEIGKNINAHKIFTDDNKSLLHNYISVEELRACTTCNACVEACPVSISPLDIITQLRRYLIMEESNAPQEWNSMFSSIENNFAPWKFSPDERDKWVSES
ncbi:MAG: (Fe-S)-binding protein [Bacteroidetes bacterium]|nr:(Fe-S)-binding protein [Bacteroidota bacterium]MBS1670380.1 (Fe-S)-binding protein [Bacteroidota bacterium]